MVACGRMDTPASISTARFTVSTLSNSITVCTVMLCSLKMRSMALRVGMSGSKLMNFCPASAEMGITLSLAKGCCGWQTITMRSLRNGTISRRGSFVGYATNPRSTALPSTSSYTWFARRYSTWIFTVGKPLRNFFM